MLPCFVPSTPRQQIIKSEPLGCFLQQLKATLVLIPSRQSLSVAALPAVGFWPPQHILKVTWWGDETLPLLSFWKALTRLPGETWCPRDSANQQGAPHTSFRWQTRETGRTDFPLQWQPLEIFMKLLLVYLGFSGILFCLFWDACILPSSKKKKEKKTLSFKSVYDFNPRATQFLTSCLCCFLQPPVDRMRPERMVK